MTAYKGHTAQKFQHLLHNNKLYFSAFEDIDLLFLEKGSLTLF